MKKQIRLLALLLAFIFVATCFIGCKKDDEKPDDGDDAVISTNGGEEEYQSKLPDTDWMGDTYLILGTSGANNFGFTNFEIWREDVGDDVVSQAVYNRNDAIKQKYNLIVAEELVPDTAKHIQTFYASNEDKYDMVIYHVINVFGHAQTGYLYDLNSVEYIDLEHPSWNKYVTEQFTFGDNIFCSTSDFLLQDKATSTVLYYNREMARDMGDGYLEDIVSNNQWTVDKMNEFMTKYAVDSSGNGSLGDEEDSFALCSDRWGYLSMCVGAGYRASTVTDGKVALAGAGDNILNILEAVGKYFFNSQGTFITENMMPLDYGRSSRIYKDGRSLFLFGTVLDIDRFGDEITFEFGVLPMPKYDADQENFYTQRNPTYSSLITIPKTVIDSEFAGFGIEALSEFSTDTTYTTYIETKCKLQDSYDQRMADMFDCIFQTPVYDIVILGDFGNIKRAIMDEVPETKMANRYATLYNRRYEAAQEEIDALISVLESFS